jgi:hypothetical protein
MKAMITITSITQHWLLHSTTKQTKLKVLLLSRSSCTASLAMEALLIELQQDQLESTSLFKINPNKSVRISSIQVSLLLLYAII